MIKKNIAFTEKMAEMVEELQEKKGYMSFSSVIHQAVVDMHTKAFPAYVREPSARETPEDRVRRKSEEKRAKEDIRREEQLAVMAELEGELIEKAGVEYVKYYTYTNSKRYEQNVPLIEMSSDLVKTQYQPTRERVEKLREQGKTDY